MKDIIDKLRILKHLLADAYNTWKSEVWDKDLDARYCCGGGSTISPCGCQGVTVREVFLENCGAYDPETTNVEDV